MGRNGNGGGSGGCVSPAIRDAYAGYKERPDHGIQETPHISGEYVVYRPDNDAYLPTYIARLANIPRDVLNDWTGSIMISREIHETMSSSSSWFSLSSSASSSKPIPIMDMNDILVFITDNTEMAEANWLPAREYQAWAYRDFMYDEHHSIKKSYMSRGTSPLTYETNNRVLANQIVTIPVANVAANIVFTIARHSNNSVYFERNDAAASRVRICDNEYARTGYLGFYTRITMDAGMASRYDGGPIVIPPHGAGSAGSVAMAALPALLSTAHLPTPEETDDEEHQCILCFNFRVNARFSPCEHTVCCSGCYSKMAKNECPVCRAVITRVMNV